MSTKRTRVLIVDDSLAMCRFVDKALSRDPGLEVVGYAHDPFEARALIKRLSPDVLTLDVEMPRMDGLTFLRNLMRLRPIPTMMLSSLTAAGAAVTFDALEAGAVDFMVKRHPGSAVDLERYVDEIAGRVAQVAKTRPSAPIGHAREVMLPDLADCHRKLRGGAAIGGGVHRLVGIGASTGGPEALRHVLGSFSAPDCALVVCQHMPERFMPLFARRLDGHSPFDIRLARDGETLAPGRGYVAPGDRHLELEVRGGRARWRLSDGEAMHGHRPAVDVLFASLAEAVADRAALVLLTGMGCDGAGALLEARGRGATTLVQDEHSSAVWGMPGRAWRMGGADAKLDLAEIGPALTALLGRDGTGAEAAASRGGSSAGEREFAGTPRQASAIR